MENHPNTTCSRLWEHSQGPGTQHKDWVLLAYSVERASCQCWPFIYSNDRLTQAQRWGSEGWPRDNSTMKDLRQRWKCPLHPGFEGLAPTWGRCSPVTLTSPSKHHSSYTRLSDSKSEVVFSVQHVPTSAPVLVCQRQPRLTCVFPWMVNSAPFHSEKCLSLDSKLNDHLTEKTTFRHINSSVVLLWTCSTRTYVVNLEEWNLLDKLFWSRNLKAKHLLSSVYCCCATHNLGHVVFHKQAWLLLLEHMASQKFNIVTCHEFPRGSYTKQFLQTYLNTKSFFNETSREISVPQNAPTFLFNKHGCLECPGIVPGPGESAVNKAVLVLVRLTF